MTASLLASAWPVAPVTLEDHAQHWLVDPPREYFYSHTIVHRMT